MSSPVLNIIVSAISDSIRAGTPLLLATLGEVYTERSGVVNLGIEGLMSVGALAGFAITLQTGNYALGLIFAALSAALLSSIHAFVCVHLKSNQTISGLALAMLGMGLSSLFGKPYVGLPLKNNIRPISVPILENIPLIGPTLFRQDVVVYVSIMLAVALWFTLFHTRYGISIRAVGENPASADSLGISVSMVRYFCTVLGGSLAGVAGAYISLGYTPGWNENITVGRGWIAVALTVFTFWNPLRSLVGAYLFGGIEAMQFRLQPMGIPPSILTMLPYIATILALMVGTRSRFRKRLGAPKALGVPYEREE
jgi:simple sugar transport system permease protein